jgi:membrane associated rhomboid family serine protease
MSLAFPKPGRALWAVLGLVAVLGIGVAFLNTWAGVGRTIFLALGCDVGVAFHQPWRLLTSGLLTDPTHPGHLIFSLMGLYFLSTSLEKRWGGARLLRFLAISVVAGNLTAIALGQLMPPGAQERFRPEFMFGPSAAITAVAVAWSREFADQTVNLFFFLPMRGKVFFWLTLGFCVLDLIYPIGLPEGVMAPFGGILVGLALGGTPSLARRAWLTVKLSLLRRRASRITIDDEAPASKPRRKPRAGAPPLRVVPGGLEDALKKRTPPKDKRYLN